jgi:erythromycin esterase
MHTQAHEKTTSYGNEEAVIRWLQQNAIPIHHIEAGNGFADLQPLKSLLKDVKVVGLGETTHGTREFFQFKHRLLEFLVTEMDFTTFAIEASYTACQPINDYVLYGAGDLASVVTGQGYVPWDMEEFVSMVSWMRARNQHMPEDQKVRFVGVDLWRNDAGRQAVLDYLRKAGSERVTATEALFAALAPEEAKWPAFFDEVTPVTLAQLLPQVDDLLGYLTSNRTAMISRSSPADFETALQYTRIMWQWLMANTPDSLRPSRLGDGNRSLFMAQNLAYLIDRDKPRAKYVAWAHNQHVSVGDMWTGKLNWGYYLRERYGLGYFALGFETARGSFWTRTVVPGKGLGDLKEVSFAPAPKRSWPWYLNCTNVGDLILNLRAPVSDAIVDQWLNTPRWVRNANWGYDEHSSYGGEVNLVKAFDAVAFIVNTTPVHPTSNAMQTIARRAWL